jgi:hypothetical protein
VAHTGAGSQIWVSGRGDQTSDDHLNMGRSGKHWPQEGHEEWGDEYGQIRGGAHTHTQHIYVCICIHIQCHEYII